MHECPECGLGHDEPIAEVIPDFVDDAPADAAAAVEIAKIEARTEIKLAEIETERWRNSQNERVSALEAELAAMREAAVPPVVIVEAPEEPVEETSVDELDAGLPDVADAPEPDQTPAPPKEKKKKSVWF